MAKITKKDANPVLALVLSLFWGLGHVIINGQQRKWLFILLAWLIGTVLCCIPGWIVAILSIIEAYKTAEHLQKGEEIDENDYFFAPMFKIVSYLDKTATFKG